MISATEYFTRAAEGDLRDTGCVTQDDADAADGLLTKINALLAAYDAFLGRHWIAIVRSGFRSAAVNACIPGAAKNSYHMTGHACDIADNDEELDTWLSTPQGIAAMEDAGLYREHHTQTISWCHLQDIAPRSGNREFFK